MRSFGGNDHILSPSPIDLNQLNNRSEDFNTQDIKNRFKTELIIRDGHHWSDNKFSNQWPRLLWLISIDFAVNYSKLL